VRGRPSPQGTLPLSSAGYAGVPGQALVVLLTAWAARHFSHQRCGVAAHCLRVKNGVSFFRWFVEEMGKAVQRPPLSVCLFRDCARESVYAAPRGAPTYPGRRGRASPAGPQLVRGPDPVNSTAKQRSRVQGQGSTHWSITFAWLLGHQLGDPGDRRASQATHSLPCAFQGPLTPSSTDAGMGTARKSGVLSSGRCKKTS